MVRVKFIGFCVALAITCGVFADSALAADKKKVLTFATISTEEMAAMAARWEPDGRARRLLLPFRGPAEARLPVAVPAQSQMEKKRPKKMAQW